MLILALDTSTTKASAAVLEDEKTLAEVSIETGNRHGERLLAALDSLYRNLGISPAEIGAYAAGIGPGAFTGLRTGLALMKGMAVANPAPAVGVSSLKTMAAGIFGAAVPVIPMIDARKRQVFAAAFSCAGPEPEPLGEEAAIDPPRAAELAHGPVILLGDGLGRYRDEILSAFGERAVIAPEPLWNPRASWTGRLAAAAIERGETDDLDSLLPVYIRDSDAELKLGPRSS